MKWMKSEITRELIILSLILTSQIVSAQEQFQQSQYSNIAFAINPAFTGVENDVRIVAGFRSQWSAIDYAPINYYGGIAGTLSSFNAKFSKGKTIRLSQSQVYGKPLNKVDEWQHGVGLYLTGDHTGPFHQYTSYFNYAFIYNVSQEYKVSFGVSGELSFQQFNDKNIALYSADLDQVYQDYLNNDRNRVEGHLNVGISVVGQQLYIGYSMHHLASNSNLETIAADVDPGIYHFLMGGYNFPLTEQLTLQPTFLFGYNKFNSMSMEFQTRMKYRELFWGGIGYRHENAVIALLGLTIGNGLGFGYSYDYQFNDIGPYTKGTHEITLSYAIYREGISSGIIW